MSDGASVYECTSNDEVIDLLQGGQGVFGIAVGKVWREVEGELASLPSEQAEHDVAAAASARLTNSAPAAPSAWPEARPDFSAAYRVPRDTPLGRCVTHQGWEEGAAVVR